MSAAITKRKSSFYENKRGDLILRSRATWPQVAEELGDCRCIFSCPGYAVFPS